MALLCNILFLLVHSLVIAEVGWQDGDCGIHKLPDDEHGFTVLDTKHSKDSV